MSASEKKIILAKFLDYEKRCTEIMDLIGENERLVGTAQEQAKRLLKSLKDSLSTESRELGLQ